MEKESHVISYDPAWRTGAAQIEAMLSQFRFTKSARITAPKGKSASRSWLAVPFKRIQGWLNAR